MEVFQSQNILNWYPFKKEQDVLLIGSELEELEKMLCEKCDKVIKTRNNLNDIKLIDKQYDVAIIIGTSKDFKLIETIKIIEKHLNLEGKILFAVDNKFGLKFFIGNPEKILDKKFASLTGYKNESEKIETYTKASIEKILNGMGYNTRFYYPLPDYKIPNVIFSDEQLPQYTDIDKYYPYFVEKSDILVDELDVFREILKTNKDMFTFFANSFLIEISKGECNKDYKYISFNNLRKEEYRLITKIANEYVEKQVINKKGYNHYENIKNNIEILKKEGIETVDYVEDGKIKSKYIEQKYLLDNVLVEKLEEGKIEEFEQILDMYVKTISVNTYKEEDYSKTVFGKYGIDVEDKKIINDLNFLENGLWDMTFKNCFYIDNKLIFFDQEWNEKSLPVEYILYRSILYTISLRRFIKIEDLFEKYQLSKFLELFRKLDDRLQEQIRDSEVWEFYKQDHSFNIDETKQEITNLNIRSLAKQAAIDNLQKENENLRESNIKLQENINKSFLYRVKRKIKKMVGGKHD